MSEDNGIKLQVLSNHYNETFALLRNDVGKRDRLFLYILIVIFMLLLYMSSPDTLSDLLNSFMSNQAGSETVSRLIDTSFVGLILWIGLLIGQSHLNSIFGRFSGPAQGSSPFLAKGRPFVPVNPSPKEDFMTGETE